MNKKQDHRNIIKERMTILLVFFFSILISGSEYIIDEAVSVEKEQQEAQEEGSSEEQSFFSVAVDAVVPFVFTSVDHAFHLIYEIDGYEVIRLPNGILAVKYPNHFSEILLERIISTNAP